MLAGVIYLARGGLAGDSTTGRIGLGCVIVAIGFGVEALNAMHAAAETIRHRDPKDTAEIVRSFPPAVLAGLLDAVPDAVLVSCFALAYGAEHVTATPNPVFRRVEVMVTMPGQTGNLAQMVTVVANENNRSL